MEWINTKLTKRQYMFKEEAEGERKWGKDWNCLRDIQQNIYFFIQTVRMVRLFFKCTLTQVNSNMCEI